MYIYDDYDIIQNVRRYPTKFDALRKSICHVIFRHVYIFRVSGSSIFLDLITYIQSNYTDLIFPGVKDWYLFDTNS